MPEGSTLAALISEIEHTVSFTPLIKLGYPPKLLEASPAALLSDCGIKDGEQIIVERNDGNIKGGQTLKVVASASLDSAKNLKQGASLIPRGSKDALIDLGKPESAKSIEQIVVRDGLITVRVQKDDNSCLFRSIGYVLERNSELSSSLRQSIP